MRDRTAPQTEGAIANSRAMIEASRRHLADIRRSLRDDQALMEAMRQDLDRWRRDMSTSLSERVRS